MIRSHGMNEYSQVITRVEFNYMTTTQGAPHMTYCPFYQHHRANERLSQLLGE